MRATADEPLINKQNSDMVAPSWCPLVCEENINGDTKLMTEMRLNALTVCDPICFCSLFASFPISFTTSPSDLDDLCTKR